MLVHGEVKQLDRITKRKEREGMITYEIAKSFDIEKIIEVFESSGIVRPTKEKERIKSMFENADLVYFAYDDGEPIGLARCVTIQN